MTTSSAVHSNAFNFMGFLQHCVDPRTGQYTMTVDIPELKSNHLCGPTVPLQLQFSPLNEIDSGFGMGWSLRLSQYTPHDHMLALSTGENYKVTGSGSQPSIKEKKLDSFHFHDEGNDTYRVVHKSGLVEILVTGGSGDQRVALPRQIRSPSGHTVNLTYVPFRGGQLLETVSDAFGTLLRIERAASNQFVTLRLHPDSGPNGEPLASFEMRLNGSGQVSAIILPTTERASWRFTYEVIRGRTCLIEVQTPVGGQELIQYRDAGHPYPNPGTPREPLPRVTQHRTVPGFGQPDIIVEYTYTTHNFLGNGASISWLDDGLDNLYRVQTSYEYGSVATLKEGTDTVRSVSRTYNRFHLLTEEVTTQGECIKRVSTEYHALDVSFDNQPPQFQMPKTVQTRWALTNDSTKTRIEVERTAFDEFGNLTEQVQANGSRETFSYYPKEGATGCPADPEGFVRNLHEKNVYPAASENGSAAVMRTLNTYQALPALDSAPSAADWLVVVEETLSSSEDNHVETLHRLQRTYNDEPDNPALHGRPSRQSETLKQHTTTTEFAYSTPMSRLAGETVDQTVETLTGFDGSTKVVTLEQSLFTGKPLVVPDVNGVLVRSEYDAMGRVTNETVAPDTVFAATRLYEYTLSSELGKQSSQRVTDVKGVKIQTLFDGLKRTVREECMDPEQTPQEYRRSYAAQYNARGELSEETEYDWLGGDELALTSSFGYDDWGLECRVVGPDNVATVTERSPFGASGVRQTSWLESATQPALKSGRSVTEFNVFNKPDSITRQDDQGATVGSLHYAYDGRGNCTEQQHRVNNVTITTGYAFDAFGRMTSTTLPDGSVVTRSFAEHSSSELPISLQVKPANEAQPTVIVGTQLFDGLERLTELRVGPRLEQFRYTEDKIQPSQRISPSGQVFDYSYTLELTSQPSAIRINGNAADEVQFSYDSQTALITGTQNKAGEPENSYRYDSFGFLQSESRANSAGAAHETHYISSRHGRQISSAVSAGFETLYDYDTSGRVATVTQGGLRAEFAYNDLGQLQQSTTTQLSSGKALRTEFEYDSLSREIQRTQTLTGQPVRTHSQVWFDDDHLQSREQHVNGQSVYKETFAYDLRGRLEEYTCAGDDVPQDAYGNRITSQIFQFDALDNIKRCVSEFADGSDDLARFTYADDDSCQLIKVTHSHASYPASTEFSYDADGHMLNDEHGRKLSYNSEGRLLEVKSASDQPLIAYRYDSHSDLVAVQKAAGSETERFYQGYSLSHAVHEATLTQCFHGQGNPLGQQQMGDDSQTLLLLTDASNSVLGESQLAEPVQTRAYSAYGEQTDDDLLSLLAFNGEVREEVSGWYLLGRGYRAYNPSLMRFHSPDSLSPFGAGGVNPYMYCAGNPISFRDPTGHVSEQGKEDPGYEDPIEQPKQGGDLGWAKWLGVGIAAIILVVSVATAPLTGGLSIAAVVAWGGIALQAAGIGLQVAGVLTENEKLSYAGVALGFIGTMAYGKGRSMGVKSAAKANGLKPGTLWQNMKGTARNPWASKTPSLENLMKDLQHLRRDAPRNSVGVLTDSGSLRSNSVSGGQPTALSQGLETARNNLRPTSERQNIFRHGPDETINPAAVLNNPTAPQPPTAYITAGRYIRGGNGWVHTGQYQAIGAAPPH